MVFVPSSTGQGSQFVRRLPIFAGFFLSVFMVATLVAGTSAAAGAEHPPIDIDSLDMVPERGWGVADQTPSETQTPNLDVLVWDMIQSGDRMFVAGGFLNVQDGKDGTKYSQPYLAAFDVDTGEWVDTFRPEFDRIIYAIDVLPNGSLLVGGEFETVNGQPRAGLVAIDPISGDTDPSFGGQVSRPYSNNRAQIRDLEVDASGQVYVAGNFAFLIGPDGARSSAAKAGRFTSPVGIPDPTWRPVIGGSSVWGIDAEPSLGEVALSGYFTVVNGETNSGYFHVVDDDTGATVPGKIDIEPNDWGRDPEVFDVVYGNGVLFHIGEQHMVRVLDPADHRLLGYHHTGIANDGFYEIGRFAGGAFQAGELIGNVLITGCHCTNGADNHYTSYTGRRTTRKNVMAYDATTGEHIEAFNADVDAVADGHWAAASDTNGCLWIGGDYHLGGAAAGNPRWLGGFARMCPDLPPLQIDPVGDSGVVNVALGDGLNLALSVVDTQNAALVWSAEGLPVGMSIDPVSGVISGVGSQAGSFPVAVTVAAADGSATSGTRVVTVVVFDQTAPEVVGVTDRVINRYAPVELFLTATDAEGARVSWSATGLPTGLNLDPATGRITGEVTEAGVTIVEVSATDAVGLTGTATFRLTVADRAERNLVVADVAAASLIDAASIEATSVGFSFSVDRVLAVSEVGVFVGRSVVTDEDAADQTGPLGVVLYDDTRREMARAVVSGEAVDTDGFAWVALGQAQRLVPGVEYTVMSQTGSGRLLSADEVSLVDGVTATKAVSGVGVDLAWPNLESSFGLGVIGPSLRILADDATPAVAAIADQVTAVDQAFELQPMELSGAGEGEEEAEPDLSWSAVGLPTGLSIDADTGRIAGTTTAAGDFRVVVTATGALGLFSSRSFTWTVLDNERPSVEALVDRSVTQYETFETTAELEVARPGTEWSAFGLPVGLSIDEASGRISGRALDEGIFNVTVTATDTDGLFGTATFTLTVAERPTVSALTANVDPELKYGTNLLGFVFTVDREMELAELGIYDADGDGAIGNTNETTVALFDNTTQAELLRAVIADGVLVEDDGFGWVPLPERFLLQPGNEYVAAVTVSGEPWTEWGDTTFIDGFNPVGSAYRGGTSVEFPDRQSTFSGRNIGPGLRIISSDGPPVLDTIDDQVALLNTEFSVSLAATSPAGRPLTWSATGLPEGLSLDAATGVLSGMPTSLGTSEVVVSVTDDAGLTASVAMGLTVRSVPVAPVLGPIADLAVAQYDTVSIQLTADDPTVTWSATGLPESLTLDPSTGLVNGSVLDAGAFTVTVAATDTDGLSTSADFVVTVEPRTTINVVQSNVDYQIKLGNNFMGYVFEVDREMTLTELGVHDANRDGRITNDGDTTIVLYDNTTRVELQRVEVPAAVVVGDDHYGWQQLTQPIVLQPGVAYALASETSGEPWSEWGKVSFVEGVNPISAAYKGGSQPGWPSRQRPFNGRHFGPSMRVVDDVLEPPAEEPPVVEPPNDGPVAGIILPRGSVWRSDDSGIDPGANWMTSGFDDSGWAAGADEFGFGDGDETTLWTPGFVTYYARTTFTVDGVLPEQLRLNLKADDGAVVYLNGTEAFRVNMGDGPVGHNTKASDVVFGSDEEFQAYDIPATALVQGENLIAVSVHNIWRGSSDVSFALELEALAAPEQPDPVDPEPADPGPGDPPVDPGPVAPVDLVTAASEWTFTDSATEGGDPLNWKSGIVGGTTGFGEFGFGDGDETTELTAGARAYYFTHQFHVEDAAVFSQLDLGLAADDGAVVYLNGVEVHRFNMPDGPIDYRTSPNTWLGGNDELMKATVLGSDALVSGPNTVAVEVHNIWRGSGDLSFALSLAAS